MSHPDANKQPLPQREVQPAQQPAIEKPKADGIKVLINNQPLQMEVAPIIENGRTLVPTRFVAEALGAKVDWHSATQTVTIQY